MQLNKWVAAVGCALFAVLASCAHQGADTPPVFIVFFHSGSAELVPESQAIIDQAVAAIRRMHPASVALASGVASGDNLRLAEPRFASIRQALVAKGVAASLIARSSLPDAKLNAGAAGDTRVEIMLLAKPPS